METDTLLQYDVLYPERLSRWWPLFKWIAAIPHYIILDILSIAASIASVFAFFAILITGRYPRDLFEFNLNVFRWFANVNAYLRLLRDEYPPFSLQSTDYPVRLWLDYPERLSRWKIFVKWLLAIPHFIVLYFLQFAQSIAVLIAFFAILFTGRYPRSLFDFVVGVDRWNWRVSAYLFLLTDTYPPFSLASDVGGEPLAFADL